MKIILNVLCEYIEKKIHFKISTTEITKFSPNKFHSWDIKGLIEGTFLNYFIIKA